MDRSSSIICVLYCVVAFVAVHNTVLADQAMSTGAACGQTTCATNEYCCGNTTCYNADAGEYCCLPAKDSEYPNAAVCAKGQSCCGEGIAMVATCINPLNETCCTLDDPTTISNGCPIGDSCCPTWGPPLMFECCGGAKSSTCCSNNEGGAAASGLCCPAETTCCVIDDQDYVTCCNKTETCGQDSCLGLF